MHLVEVRGRYKMIGVSHPLKWIEELAVEECRVHLGELLQEEPQVEGDKREVPRKEARHLPLECLTGTMGNLTTLRIIVNGRHHSIYLVEVPNTKSPLAHLLVILSKPIDQTID